MPEKKVGFIGIGAMGKPMAERILDAGYSLTVWNRTEAKCTKLLQKGAVTTETPYEVFNQCDIIFLMLLNSNAFDDVLGINSNPVTLHGKTIVNTSTIEADASKKLEAFIKNAGGEYVEAPVSGSKVPAENGQLITMTASNKPPTSELKGVLNAFSKEVIYCGQVPNALLMKFAVNVFLITSVTGLAESLHYAESMKLDTGILVKILNDSQMASDISKVKTGKYQTEDFSKQASIADVLKNNELINQAANKEGIISPLMRECQKLYEMTSSTGHQDSDMIAVINALRTMNAKEEHQTF